MHLCLGATIIIPPRQPITILIAAPSNQDCRAIHGYVTYAELNNLLCSGGFSREQIEDVLHQFAEMGINVTGAEEMPEDAQPRAPMPERDPDEQARADAVYAEALKAPWVAYGNVFEGYWDGAKWRSAAGIPCEPTHWMPLPSPPPALILL